jgi:hypothetical protein
VGLVVQVAVSVPVDQCRLTVEFGSQPPPVTESNCVAAALVNAMELGVTVMDEPPGTIAEATVTAAVDVHVKGIEVEPVVLTNVNARVSGLVEVNIGSPTVTGPELPAVIAPDTVPGNAISRLPKGNEGESTKLPDTLRARVPVPPVTVRGTDPEICTVSPVGRDRTLLLYWISRPSPVSAALTNVPLVSAPFGTSAGLDTKDTKLPGATMFGESTPSVTADRLGAIPDGSVQLSVSTGESAAAGSGARPLRTTAEVTVKMLIAGRTATKRRSLHPLDRLMGALQFIPRRRAAAGPHPTPGPKSRPRCRRVAASGLPTRNPVAAIRAGTPVGDVHAAGAARCGWRAGRAAE